MPLTFPNRSRAAIGPRGVLAFGARDGHKSVCCLLPLTTLTSKFGAAEPTTLFDRNRAAIEAAASALYDVVGSDECGELVILETDLRERSPRPTRFDHVAAAAAAAGGTRHTPYLPPADSWPAIRRRDKN